MLGDTYGLSLSLLSRFGTPRAIPIQSLLQHGFFPKQLWWYVEQYMSAQIATAMIGGACLSIGTVCHSYVCSENENARLRTTSSPNRMFPTL